MAANSTDADTHPNISRGDHDAHQPMEFDHTAQTTVSEAPLNEQANKSEPDVPTVRPRTGRIAQKRWFAAQTRLRKKERRGYIRDSMHSHPSNPPWRARPRPEPNVSKAFSASPPPGSPPKPMSNVFIIPELLERILLNLETGFIITTALMVCRGFKQSMDLSPVSGKGGTLLFISPLRMIGKFEAPNRLHLYFHTDRATFRRDAATESFRELRMFDQRPRSVRFHWFLGETSLGEGTWRDLDEDREITFGQIIDVMTEILAWNATPYHLWIDW
ncbi:hypothetical protein Q7P36_004609 [Cladosporium allicinum]